MVTVLPSRAPSFYTYWHLLQLAAVVGCYRFPNHKCKYNSDFD